MSLRGYFWLLGPLQLWPYSGTRASGTPGVLWRELKIYGSWRTRVTNGLHSSGIGRRSPLPMPGQVCVGIGVLIVRPGDGHVLLGRRKGAHGSGTWALPGGWLEKNEAFHTCALREMEEETGLSASDVLDKATVLPTVANNVMDKGVHSVTVFVRLDLRAAAFAGNVRVCEPDKCHEWRWVDPASSLPQPMFPPLEYLVKSDYWQDEIAKSAMSQLRQLARDLPLLLAGAAIGVAAVSVAASRRR